VYVPDVLALLVACLTAAFVEDVLPDASDGACPRCLGITRGMSYSCLRALGLALRGVGVGKAFD
jgi:hypothetical protein